MVGFQNYVFMQVFHIPHIILQVGEKIQEFKGQESIFTKLRKGIFGGLFG